MLLDASGNRTSSEHFKYTHDYYKQLIELGHLEPNKGNKMNGTIELDVLPVDKAVALVADADGKFAPVVEPGTEVTEGDVIGYVVSEEGSEV